MPTATIKKLTPKQKLIAKFKKMGGVENNRKALEELKDVFINMPQLDVETLRKAAWRMK